MKTNDPRRRAEMNIHDTDSDDDETRPTIDRSQPTDEELDPTRGRREPPAENSPVGEGGGAGMTNPTTAYPDPDQERFRERRM
jgi:hypothetical protein